MTDTDEIKTKFPEKAFEDFPLQYRQEVKDFIKEHSLFFNVKTRYGQAFCLMLYNYPNPIKGKKETNFFFNKIGRVEGCSIQAFNKIEQRGFEQPKTRGKYSIVYPFKYSIYKEKRVKKKEILNKEKKDEQVNMIKKYIENVHMGEYQEGHMNPDRGYTEDNMMWQPSYQAKLRDEFIFFDRLNPLKCIPNPTHKNYEKNMEKMNLTENQYKIMLELCKKKLKKEI